MPIIKPTKPDYIPAIRQLEVADAEWICPYSREEHLAWMADPNNAHFSVFTEENPDPVGFFLIRGLENANRSLELKRIVVGLKGKGIGRHCMQWIKQYCFEDLAFHRLWLDVFIDNKRAQSLYLSEGFQIEGTLRESIKQGDIYRSLYLLSILENEYAIKTRLQTD